MIFDYLVQLNIDSIIQSTHSVKYTYTCGIPNGPYSGLDNSPIHFVLYAQKENSDKSSDPIPCSNVTETGTLNGLVCSTVYNISAYLVYVDGNISDCPLTQTTNVTTSYYIGDLHCPSKLYATKN